jgi:hypothetical protein
MLNHLNKFSWFIFIVTLNISFILFYYGVLNDIFSFSLSPTHINEFILKSKCASQCQKDIVHIQRLPSAYNIVVKNERTRAVVRNYSVERTAFEQMTFTCDLYKTLQRGPNQSVISFALFGKDRLYYDFIHTNMKLARQFYSNWTLRVYHDDSIDSSFVCQVQ